MDSFSALAEPRRRLIIELLASKGQLSASQIYKRFEITAQAVSQHLRILLDAKLVKMEKRSQQHMYSLSTNSIEEIEKWVEHVHTLWNESLDRLENVIDEEKNNSE